MSWRAAAALLCLACSANEPSYFPAAAPVEIGGGSMTEPFAVVDLPFRPPSDGDRGELDRESQRLGFPVPWLRTDKVAVSILYTVTNLGDRPATARLELDGASEFASYDVVALRAAAAMAEANNEDEIIVLPLLEVPPMTLEPGAKLSGTVREDDFEEAALDLDAIGRFQAVPAAVLVNHSARSRAGLDMIPAGHVRPALYRVRVALIGNGHLKLEVVARVRDEANQLLLTGGTPFDPMPPTYLPPMVMP